MRGGDNNLQRSRNNIMITETIWGVNVYKLIEKRSDNQVQSISFSSRNQVLSVFSPSAYRMFLNPLLDLYCSNSL